MSSVRSKNKQTKQQKEIDYEQNRLLLSFYELMHCRNAAKLYNMEPHILQTLYSNLHFTQYASVILTFIVIVHILSYFSYYHIFLILSILFVCVCDAILS